MITAGLISGKRPLLEMGLSEGISPSYNSHRGDGLLAGFRPQGREGGDDSHFNLCKRLVFVFGCAEDYYASVSCKDFGLFHWLLGCISRYIKKYRSRFLQLL
ncbi:hypothetical protein BDL97_07G102300 [Sphagnum fallax]|nr:hypothetical protein BDL97_07G102300 [Sphagnum fallax]